MVAGEAQFVLRHHYPAVATALDPAAFRSVGVGEKC